MNDETAVLVWSGASALVWIAIGSVIARTRQDGLHPGTIFCMLFALSYPLKLVATSYGFTSLDSLALGAEWRLRALGLANLSAVMFIMPLALGGQPRPPQPRDSTKPDPPAAGASWWLLAAIGLLIASYGFDLLWRLASFEALAELREQRDQARLFSGSLALTRDAGTFCLITHFGAVIRRWRNLDPKFRGLYALGWAAISYVLLAMSGSKYMGLLPFATGILVANAVHIERHGRGFRLSRTAAFGLIAFIGIALTGVVRGFGEIPTSDGVLVTALIQTAYAFDAPDNLSFIVSRVDDWWAGDLAFEPTLQYTFLSAIPRVFWRDKPLVMGNQYIMQRYLPERFTDETGEVISPSMAGEMLVSGGFWFVIAWSLLLGIVLTLVYRWTQRHPRSPLSLAVYVWLCLNVFNLLRSGTGIVSPLLIFTVVSTGVLVVSELAVTVVRGAVVPMERSVPIGGEGAAARF